ncbi:hypothetical protein T484DRAFT_3337363 [Baffinella frigidus]|nr:hypothetical protein T484DRAFT_3337363 [Cryptophyta sp. CCMP2293]
MTRETHHYKTLRARETHHWKPPMARGTHHQKPPMARETHHYKPLSASHVGPVHPRETHHHKPRRRETHHYKPPGRGTHHSKPPIIASLDAPRTSHSEPRPTNKRTFIRGYVFFFHFMAMEITKQVSPDQPKIGFPGPTCRLRPRKPLGRVP